LTFSDCSSRGPPGHGPSVGNPLNLPEVAGAPARPWAVPEGVGSLVRPGARQAQRLVDVVLDAVVVDVVVLDGGAIVVVVVGGGDVVVVVVGSSPSS
jgi:hypothetical protein